MGNRPTDWHILDLDRDPVPGDPYEVKELARKLGDFADDVSSALRSVKGLSGNNAVQDWAGLAADAYREQFGDLPGELTKLEKSYRLASGALETYWPKLETAQADADRALAQGRTARQDLDAAKTTQGNANDWVKRAGDKSKEYQADPKPGVEPPSADEVRTATRNALDASNAQKSANSAVHDAQQRLDAAKELAAQAAHLRDTAASTAEHALHEASDAGIKNKHWWEKAVDWVADHWDDIVAVCKVIVAVLGIIVMIIGGPLAWIVLAAALVVLADTLVKYAQGKASLWDVLFAALDCIPMFKGLTTAGGLLKMAKELPALLKSGKALENIANSVRKGAGAIRSLGRDFKTLITCGDPIDMATGEMVMSATDVDLPGVLPLELLRHHRSSFRGGRWFGATWASTLDQRLWLDDEGVRFTTEDGMVLYYPVPGSDAELLPVEGPRWPLRWDGTAGGTMTVTQPESGRILHFTPIPGAHPGQLPLSAVTDCKGNRISVVYGADGTPVEMVHDGGYRIGITTAADRITALHLLNHPDQPVLVRYSYGPQGHPTGIVNSSGRPLTFDYDPHGRITGWEDRNGHWYRYEYDDQGRCVRTNGAGGVLRYNYVYDDANRTTTAVNSLGHSTRYQFNDHYQLAAETDPLGHTTQYTWDRYDRLLTRTDALGRTTRHSYDQQGNLCAVHEPDGTVTTSDHNSFGLPVRITDPNGQVWRHAYDDHGNRLSTTDPLGAETRFRYSARGHLTSVTDADGHTRDITCSTTGLPVTVADPLGNTTTVARDAFGRIVSVTDPLDRTTHLHWTIEGRPSRRDYPDGTSQTWSWDGEGNLLSHTDPAGYTTRHTHGPFDRPVSRTDPDGTAYAFTYDDELNLATVTNPQGLTWKYTYDPANRVIAETDFNDRTLTYTYDSAGQLSSRTNGAGETLTYLRDQSGAITEQHSPDTTTRYAYDPCGRLLRSSNAHTESTFNYDAVGRTLSETVDGRTIAYTYDLLGRRTARRTPGGIVSTWTYDAADRPLTLDTAGRQIDFIFDAAGRETARTLGPDLTLTQNWDTTDRLVTQSVSHGPHTGQTLLQRRAYTYRPDGYLTEIDELTTGTSRFTLDPAGRVTDVHAPGWSETYQYDTLGNVTRATIPAGTNPDERKFSGTLLRRAGRTLYEYDAQGRLLHRTQRLLNGQTRTWTYRWDAEDRLTDVTTPHGEHWHYTYDPLGRRTAKYRLTTDGTIAEQTTFTWDGARLTEQTAPDGRTTTWDYSPDSHRPLTQTEHHLSQTDVDIRFHSIVTDITGTPTELVSSDGELTWQRRHTLWGAPGPGQADGVPACALRLPGQYADPETGLNYNYFRYYEPETARYISPDPLGLAPAPNQHAYVHNPHTWTDPLGLTPCNVVYRNLRADEDPLVGLVAKNPAATYKPAGHILHGSRPNWASQFISTTRSRAVALDSQWASDRVVAIDLSKISGEIFDLSTDAGRALHQIKGFTAINRTKSSMEVLITGHIPPEAISWVKGGP